MRGVGGPLLTIGDLLSDLAGNDGSVGMGTDMTYADHSTAVALPSSEAPLVPGDLAHIFEEYYTKLTDSLEADDRSWADLMLKLCAALRKADELVAATGVNTSSLLEKVQSIEKILERGDRTVAIVKDICNKQNPASISASSDRLT